MRRVLFEKEALKDLKEWANINIKMYNKIIDLLHDINKTPFKGIGKPEALKYELKGFWSRRINKEHRLVYKVTDKEIIVISCKYHYT